jgi:hypothetical protein
VSGIRSLPRFLPSLHCRGTSAKLRLERRSSSLLFLGPSGCPVQHSGNTILLSPKARGNVASPGNLHGVNHSINGALSLWQPAAPQHGLRRVRQRRARRRRHRLDRVVLLSYYSQPSRLARAWFCRGPSRDLLTVLNEKYRKSARFLPLESIHFAEGSRGQSSSARWALPSKGDGARSVTR